MSHYTVFHSLLAIALFGQSATCNDNRPVRITFEDLRVERPRNAEFCMSMLPTAIRQLDGRKIQIRGHMGAVLKEHSNKAFPLEMYIPRKMRRFEWHERIWVQLSSETGIDYRQSPITVEGVLKISPPIEGEDIIFRVTEAYEVK